MTKVLTDMTVEGVHYYATTDMDHAEKRENFVWTSKKDKDNPKHLLLSEMEDDHIDCLIHGNKVGKEMRDLFTTEALYREFN